jgi:hypothetical protein
MTSTSYAETRASYAARLRLDELRQVLPWLRFEVVDHGEAIAVLDPDTRCAVIAYREGSPGEPLCLDAQAILGRLEEARMSKEKEAESAKEAAREAARRKEEVGRGGEDSSSGAKAPASEKKRREDEALAAEEAAKRQQTERSDVSGAQPQPAVPPDELDELEDEDGEDEQAEPKPA